MKKIFLLIYVIFLYNHYKKKLREISLDINIIPDKYKYGIYRKSFFFLKKNILFIPLKIKWTVNKKMDNIYSK